MPLTLTTTALGAALSTATSGAWVPLKTNPGIPVVTIVASAIVGAGAVVAIEGRERGTGISPSDTTPARELYRATVAANGNVVVPLQAVTENMKLPDELRITVVSRTDGTFTSSLVTTA